MLGGDTMKDIVGKCGYHCSRCPSYKGNIKSQKDKVRCSDGWHKYYGFRMMPEKIRRCEGCQAPADEKPIRYQNCYIRKCASKNRAQTCGHCSGYPCEDVERNTSVHTREAVAARLGISEDEIPEQDYLKYIEPYEGITHLNEIRAALDPKDILEMRKVSSRPRLTDFPDNLPLPKKDITDYKNIHRLISEIKTFEDVSHARKHILSKRVRHMLKLLYAFGVHGEWKKKGSTHLVIDSDTYLTQGIPQYKSVMEKLFELLKGYGVHCDHTELKKEWITGTGALRKGEWYVKMRFDEKAGGPPALKALKTYVEKIDKKYGEKGYTYFQKADMRVLHGDGI